MNKLYKSPQIYAGLGVGGLAIAARRQPSDYRREGLQTATTGVRLGKVAFGGFSSIPECLL